MVMERLDAARKLAQNQTPERQKAIRLAGQILRGFGVADPGPKQPRSKSAEKIVLPDLEALVAKQVDRLIELKFHEAFGLTEEQYRLSFILPEGARKPQEYEGRFDVALVVVPRVSLFTQHSLSRPKIIEFINTYSIENLTPVPKRPYLMWTHDGQRYRPFTVEQARERFADDEIGSPQIEVTGLYLQHPAFFRNRGIDAAGSRVGGGRAPYLDTFYGLPRVDARLIDSPDGSWGALSRGTKIIELGS